MEGEPTIYIRKSIIWIEWRTELGYHRDKGPSVISSEGYKAWYNKGILHREDGPAVIKENGVKEYYYKGIWLDESWFQRIIYGGFPEF